MLAAIAEPSVARSHGRDRVTPDTASRPPLLFAWQARERTCPWGGWRRGGQLAGGGIPCGRPRVRSCPGLLMNRKC